MQLLLGASSDFRETLQDFCLLTEDVQANVYVCFSHLEEPQYVDDVNGRLYKGEMIKPKE